MDSAWLYRLLQQEMRQKKEEGSAESDVNAVVAGLTEQSAPSALEDAYARLASLVPAPGFPFIEPNSWEEIAAASPGLKNQAPRTTLSDADLNDRIRGAWFGRCAGCALGKPLETSCYSSYKDGVPGWKGVRIYLSAANAWPLDDYVPDIGEVDGYEVRCSNSCRGNVQFMESDDDIRYTVLGLLMLESKAARFTTEDVARLWTRWLPIGITYTAERAAYINLVQVLDRKPLDDDAIHWITTHLNPYREWIGAQIRADGWGYGAAGDPALAAQFAWRDASLSHTKNGIYGEMLFAAVIASAAASGSTMDALRTGLDFIPSSSRLYADVSAAIQIGANAANLDQMHEELWKRWGHYDAVHTNNNAALVAAALAYGGDDFEKVIVGAVTGGWDTDCNGATAGSVWGAAYGFDALPRKWIDPLNDKLYADVAGFHPIAISECSDRTVSVARKLEKEQQGTG